MITDIEMHTQSTNSTSPSHLRTSVFRQRMLHCTVYTVQTYRQRPSSGRNSRNAEKSTATQRESNVFGFAGCTISNSSFQRPRRSSRSCSHLRCLRNIPSHLRCVPICPRTTTRFLKCLHSDYVVNKKIWQHLF